MRGRLSGGRPERPLLLTVSRLAPEKNVGFLAEVIRQIPEATLAIVGDGPTRPELERCFAGTDSRFLGYLKGEELAAAYASADATPLFIIAMNDYVTASGDAAFAREHWDNAWRAYQFLKSTYNANGLPRNFGVGHGWVEGGPLLPVETESYQSGLGAAAVSGRPGFRQPAGR